MFCIPCSGAAVSAKHLQDTAFFHALGLLLQSWPFSIYFLCLKTLRLGSIQVLQDSLTSITSLYFNFIFVEPSYPQATIGLIDLFLFFTFRSHVRHLSLGVGLKFTLVALFNTARF